MGKMQSVAEFWDFLGLALIGRMQSVVKWYDLPDSATNTEDSGRVQGSLRPGTDMENSQFLRQ